MLDEDEADLPQQSVVLVSQILTVDKLALIDKIGTLSKARVEQILQGVKFLIEP